MKDFDINDQYVIGLAERQMAAMSEIRTMVYKAAKKGEWSGWKVKIDYQCKDKNGIAYRAERWYFIDKDCKQVIKSFEIPLP